ncbi:hypothetical protein FN976_11475 [Caenimonas sedimenti]|uniref:GIY-YIG domain-containing protein n=1 Tax=Caenimonas sedimenti TaxID=2596921 RepID=A0A562ZSY8_9BURK|nr:hypothetical protein [Caenimonas sedimenti]TWO71527.1 hypothetical protein FN976_11475 [Caenimonas sedimenti]
MKAVIDWRLDEDPRWGSIWDYRRVLYTYSHPKTGEILYLGKADRCSVGERLRGKHKRQIFSQLTRVEDVGMLDVRVGLVHIEQRFSSALLGDIESLLIQRIRPRYNVQSLNSRTARPGLLVVCSGDWHSSRRRFLDA